jgi:hypothetical protein
MRFPLGYGDSVWSDVGDHHVPTDEDRPHHVDVGIMSDYQCSDARWWEGDSKIISVGITGSAAMAS